jgi:hypothetical protein
LESFHFTRAKWQERIGLEINFGIKTLFFSWLVLLRYQQASAITGIKVTLLYWRAIISIFEQSAHHP